LILKKGTLTKDKFRREDDNHRDLLVTALMKCADISNPTRPFSIAKYWTLMIQEEFFMQVNQHFTL
jgi:hypothetical protein